MTPIPPVSLTQEHFTTSMVVCLWHRTDRYGLNILPMPPRALPDEDLKFDAPVEGAAFGGAVIGNGA
jgi:hypothetical protein